jgi:6-phosphogluconolactonase
VHPGYHLCAHGFLSDGVAGYNATDTAPPQAIPGVPSGLAGWPQVASPDGRFLYVASGATRTLLVYSIGHDGPPQQQCSPRQRRGEHRDA